MATYNNKIIAITMGGSGIQKMVGPGSGCGHPVMYATSC